MTTSHLTQLILNSHSRDVHRDLRDRHELHRTLMRLLPDDLGVPARAECNLLYRYEDTAAGPVLLVQADNELDAARLPAGYLTGHRSTTLTALLDRLVNGATVRYRIVANPSKRVNAPGQPMHGKVVGLYRDDALEWWQRQAGAAGLVSVMASTSPEPQARASRPNGRQATHHAVRYDGVATVADAPLLAAALRTGIGRGKSYGLGLLTLALA